ncbi:MAG: GNAT family N-acetyltransferase [Lachnospiraceae bacterium]|nr:GNAT family N-acetyltransferase [Lachnospiraceae bacterium]
MECEIRLATGGEILQALDLAWRMFVKYDAPDYGAEHTERMRVAIEDRLKDLSIYSERLMVVALVDGNVIGMLETYGTNRISLLFVDSEYQRKGIATALMDKIAGELKVRGYDKIVLNASTCGLAFYKHYGFAVLEEERNTDTPWKTPMWYPLSM